MCIPYTARSKNNNNKMSILGIIGWVIVAAIVIVLVIYAIGLGRRAWKAVNLGIDMGAKELLSIKDNLYEGSIGLIKK